MPDSAPDRLRHLAQDWAGADVSERSAFQTWLIRFCEALGVEPPDPPTPNYRFELPVAVVDREGRETTNFIDCWKRDHFALEAKASEGAAADVLLRKAFGQVRNYVAHVSGDPPPYLMVLDVPKTLIVWNRWSGSYGDFAAGHRIALPSLHERPNDIALLYDIFTQPSVRDPRGRAQAVTRDIATRLAELAAELESRGFQTERVARFLMRCVFSCFAEDVALLPNNLFRRTLETARASGRSDTLDIALTSLWNTMDRGGMFGADFLHRFNGHFFSTVEALPLQTRDVDLLIESANYDWAQVEPSIFGTLLVRALDPEERHRLGAEYTPREFIERLVEPTVVEPIRERWVAVQAVIVQLEERGRARDRTQAVTLLREFHTWLRQLSFLDPACGSGNFLYVTMAAVKRVEIEVLNEIQRFSGGQGGLVLDEVHPSQFHGIEIKPWAREIAELTLWIGYHQFWRETHGGRSAPDPILEDTGTIECRDAVLEWDSVERRPDLDTPDPTARLPHPVTGALVPDPDLRTEYQWYVGARPSPWPRADFIIGNPPYVGNRRMRTALGDGYVDALRAAYPGVPESADLVMYWWARAAQKVAAGETLRAGLITTNSITQASHQPLIREAQRAGARVIWAAPDHPWGDDVSDADVRVAMTVLSTGDMPARWIRSGPDGAVLEVRQVSQLNDDLSPFADVPTAAAIPLKANQGLSFRGYNVVGRGFILTQDEARRLLADERNRAVVRPHVNGRDLAGRSRGVWIIDFGMMEEEEARSYPQPFQIVQDRVRPERLGDRDEGFKKFWWRFGRPRPRLRAASEGLSRTIVTPYVARQRFFTFLDRDVAPDDKIVVVASDNALILGVLSSYIHRAWAEAAGTRLGVGNDPTYNNPRCFDPFPFPQTSLDREQRIGRTAESIVAHRAHALAQDTRVTMTGMYNIVSKLRAGSPLSTAERRVHETAACGVLLDLHDQLDQAVAAAYNWEWPLPKEQILEKVVSLHSERVSLERRGIIFRLRSTSEATREGHILANAENVAVEPAGAAQGDGGRPGWPATAVEQIAALGNLLSKKSLSLEEAASSFSGGRRDLVARHLETLVLMGEASVDSDSRYHLARKVA